MQRPGNHRERSSFLRLACLRVREGRRRTERVALRQRDREVIHADQHDEPIRPRDALEELRDLDDMVARVHSPFACRADPDRSTTCPHERRLEDMCPGFGVVEIDVLRGAAADDQEAPHRVAGRQLVAAQTQRVHRESCAALDARRQAGIRVELDPQVGPKDEVVRLAGACDAEHDLRENEPDRDGEEHEGGGRDGERSRARRRC
ncbi:MAG: hypothetical protein IPJ78_03425 [Gemmatimonadetes bacterium]|nr:hypothetical protein [Gemmatimonadota bacterium]